MKIKDCYQQLSQPLAATLHITLIALFSLILAYIAEYGFALLPCELCLIQRIPFYVIVALGGIALFPSMHRHSHWFLLLVLVALIVNTVFASYHTGVEQGWWPGPSSCTSDNTLFGDLEALRAHILGTPIIRCDKPAIEVLGITMASANAILCFLLSLYGGWVLIHSRNNISSSHD